MAPKVTNILDYFYQINWLDVSKIAQSGHTVTNRM